MPELPDILMLEYFPSVCICVRCELELVAFELPLLMAFHPVCISSFSLKLNPELDESWTPGPPPTTPPEHLEDDHERVQLAVARQEAE